MILTVNKSAHLDDWYLIERAEHDGQRWEEVIQEDRFTYTQIMYSRRICPHVDVEGAAAEMVEIVATIQRRGHVAFKRCAVDATRDPVLLWSPRNSGGILGKAPLTEADNLAREIFVGLGQKVQAERAKVDEDVRRRMKELEKKP